MKRRTARTATHRRCLVMRAIDAMTSRAMNRMKLRNCIGIYGVPLQIRAIKSHVSAIQILCTRALPSRKKTCASRDLTSDRSPPLPTLRPLTPINANDHIHNSAMPNGNARPISHRCSMLGLDNMPRIAIIHHPSSITHYYVLQAFHCTQASLLASHSPWPAPTYNESSHAEKVSGDGSCGGTGGGATARHRPTPPSSRVPYRWKK